MAAVHVPYCSKSTFKVCICWAIIASYSHNESEQVCSHMPTLVDIVCACQCMQVVILAGGTKDFHTAPTPLDEWVSDAIELIQNVSTDHM